MRILENDDGDGKVYGEHPEAVCRVGDTDNASDCGIGHEKQTDTVDMGYPSFFTGIKGIRDADMRY